jgi:hypothetical protein
MKGNFSETEVQNFIKLGGVLASKAVLTYVQEVVAECAAVKEGDRKEIEKERDRICKLIKKTMEFENCGFTQCEFNEIKYKLNISLVLVDAGYRTDIAIPDASYARELIKQYGFLKEVAHAFWNQYIQTHKTLYERISKFCGGMCLDRLIVPANNPTVMYFDECNRRNIGIFAYYVDEQGNPLRKK